MKILSPFFLLIQRPLVLFGAIGWMIIATLLIGGLVTSGGDRETFMDAAYLTVVVLSVYTGWIAGACVLELQQSSFAFTLPGSENKLIPGFLLAGVISVALAAALVAGASPFEENTPLLFLVGIGGYALGGAIRDPQSEFMTGLSIALFLVLVGTSGTLGLFAERSPALVAAGSVGLLLMGIHRLFARAAFRGRPINPRSMVLAFSLDKLSKVDRRRAISYGPRKSSWTSAYLGSNAGNWVRAAWYETYGEFKLRSFLVFMSRSWGLFLVLLLAAGEAREDIGFFKSLCWSLHDAIMRSPHSPEYGEKGGPFLIIAVGLLILGATMAAFRPVTLVESLMHPVSRQLKARVMFFGSLLDLSILLGAVAPIMFILGHAAGWVVGIESRFDYMPYFFRVLMVASILMPFAYRVRLQLQQAAGNKDSSSLVGIIFMHVLFVLVGMLLVFASGHIFKSAGIELLILFTLLLLSRVVYETRLQSWYRTADLC